MTVRAIKPDTNIREELARLRGEVSAQKFATGKQVWATGLQVDDSSYSTTSTTLLAAQGGTFEAIKPTRKGTKLRCWIESRARADYSAGTGNDVGGYIAPKYKVSTATGWSLPPLVDQRSFISTNTAVNAPIIDDTPAHFFELDQDQLNLESGTWEVAVFFSAVYAGNTITIYETVFSFEEIEE